MSLVAGSHLLHPCLCVVSSVPSSCLRGQTGPSPKECRQSQERFFSVLVPAYPSSACVPLGSGPAPDAVLRGHLLAPPGVTVQEGDRLGLRWAGQQPGGWLVCGGSRPRDHQANCYHSPPQTMKSLENFW